MPLSLHNAAAAAAAAAGQFPHASLRWRSPLRFNAQAIAVTPSAGSGASVTAQGLVAVAGSMGVLLVQSGGSVGRGDSPSTTAAADPAGPAPEAAAEPAEAVAAAAHAGKETSRGASAEATAHGLLLRACQAVWREASQNLLGTFL